MAADDGNYLRALRYYGSALVKGALPPRLAVKALAQVLVRRSAYARFRR
jgi:hypothetical protein